MKDAIYTKKIYTRNYVWYKNGQVFVKKDEGVEVVRINNFEQKKSVIAN